MEIQWKLYISVERFFFILLVCLFHVLSFPLIPILNFKTFKHKRGQIFISPYLISWTFKWGEWTPLIFPHTLYSPLPSNFQTLCKVNCYERWMTIFQLRFLLYFKTVGANASIVPMLSRYDTWTKIYYVHTFLRKLLHRETL